jgi:hypothetical protein
VRSSFIFMNELDTKGGAHKVQNGMRNGAKEFRGFDTTGDDGTIEN